jgi:chaperonin GroES
MALNIKPLGDRLVVEPLELAVGPGRLDEDGKRIPMEVKVGDTIVYAKYSGTSFKTEGGKDILFMRESDVLAILE